MCAYIHIYIYVYIYITYIYIYGRLPKLLSPIVRAELPHRGVRRIYIYIYIYAVSQRGLCQGVRQHKCTSTNAPALKAPGRCPGPLGPLLRVRQGYAEGCASRGSRGQFWEYFCALKASSGRDKRGYARGSQYISAGPPCGGHQAVGHVVSSRVARFPPPRVSPPLGPQT